MARGKKTIIIITTIILIVIAAVVAIVLFAQTNSGTRPGYTTVIPAGTSISQLGGWQRISPPESDPVFAYSDTIDGIAVNVSQQPLPQSFKNDTDNQIAELAKTYSATDTINANGVKAYIGTSAKGPQSVIFTKENLLILIKSQKKIDDKSWTRYINSLK